MALIAPMLILLIFGILEFGVVFNDASAQRQGVREAARQAAVANFGPTATCSLTGVPSTTDQEIRNLMCLTKAQPDVGSNARVKVAFLDPTLTAEAPDGLATGNSILVCVAKPMSSTTGLFAPLLNSRHHRARAAYRIEQIPADADEKLAGAETHPPGANWSWCI